MGLTIPLALLKYNPIDRLLVKYDGCSFTSEIPKTVQNLICEFYYICALPSLNFTNWMPIELFGIPKRVNIG